MFGPIFVIWKIIMKICLNYLKKNLDCEIKKNIFGGTDFDLCAFQSTKVN